MVIGLMGFGTVGAGVYELAKEQKDLEIRYVLDLREIGIPELTHRAEDLWEDPAVDTVIEVLGGLHPAYEFVTAALKAGKNVVTANKYLVATYYEELLGLAKEHGVAFRCTAAVGGGIGWLTALERVRRLEPVLGVEGIMNGTTNYILTNMAENGISFETALSEAQALGYAEADPSADIDGKDIMHKLLLSASVSFGVSLKLEEIPVYGIRHITDEDIRTFQSQGLTCKIMGTARREGEQVAAYVIPMLLSQSLAAAVPTNFNLITYDTEYTGRMSFYGQGAGRYPTAGNVVQDCLDLVAGVDAFYSAEFAPMPVCNDIVNYRFYIRTTSSKVDRVAAEQWGKGIVTKPMSVTEVTALYQELRAEDEKTFVAAIKE